MTHSSRGTTSSKYTLIGKEGYKMISEIFEVFEEHVQKEYAPAEEPKKETLFEVEAPEIKEEPQQTAPVIDEEALAGRVASIVLEALKKEEQGDDGH